MRFKTPHFGPMAGKLVIDDVREAPEVDSSTAAVPVALPDGPTAGKDAPKSRGRDGAAKEHQEELRRAGVEATFTECQERVSSALALIASKRNK